jgi:hypothetical protein
LHRLCAPSRRSAPRLTESVTMSLLCRVVLRLFIELVFVPANYIFKPHNFPKLSSGPPRGITWLPLVASAVAKGLRHSGKLERSKSHDTLVRLIWAKFDTQLPVYSGDSVFYATVASLHLKRISTQVDIRTQSLKGQCVSRLALRR